MITNALMKTHMGDFGHDVHNLTADFVGEQMTPEEARRIYKFSQTEKCHGLRAWLVEWTIGDHWFGVRILKNSLGTKYVQFGCRVPVIAAKRYGEEFESCEHFMMHKSLGEVKTPEEAVRKILDYRWAPRCGGQRKLPSWNGDVRVYDSETDEYITEPFEDYEVTRYTTMRCPTVVHKEGALCGGCLQQKYFKSFNTYRNDIEKIED